MQPQATAFTHAATAALSQLVANAGAARYAHALATKEARALRALRASALDLAAVCARRCAGGLGNQELRTQCVQLGAPFLQAP